MTRLRTATRRQRLLAVLACSLIASLLAPGLAAAKDSTGTFVGADGLTYSSAPLVMIESNGQMFYGPELDLACGASERLSVPMRALSRMVRIIEKSGRQVVFSIAPGKSATMRDQMGELPHGLCDKVGLAAQNRLLDTYRDPAYLPLRRRLMDTSRQMYWKSDLHWTTVGGAVYARTLARRLDPSLGRRQRYHYGTETRLGLLSGYAGLSTPETVQMASPAGRVKVRNVRRGPPWSGYPEFTFSNSWVSRPARLTWPGRTLLLGDSFMWYALENLRPIFSRGKFVWFVVSDDVEVVREIKKADTVVIEVYQLVTPGTPIATSEFRARLKRALSHRPAP